MSTLMLHTEGTSVTVRVKEFVDREEDEPDFWVIEVKTDDLQVEFFFHNLSAIKDFCLDLGDSIHALEKQTAPQEVV